MPIQNHRTPEETEYDQLSYDDLRDLKPIGEYTQGKIVTPGQYSRDTEVGQIDSQIFYIQDEESIGTSVAGHLMADTLMGKLEVEGPEIFYDQENGKILVQEMPGVPSHQYRATSLRKMVTHMLGAELPGNPQQVDEAIGLKYFLGDSDIPPNIVVTESTAAPIDFDKTGEQAENSLQQTKEYAEEVYNHFNWTFSEDEFEESLEEMAEGIDLEELQSELEEGIEEAPEHEQKKNYLIRNSIENFEVFR